MAPCCTAGKGWADNDIATTTVFKAVCEFHSVTKAADELFISRTAISRSINALEQELGIVLFTHTTTGLGADG